MIIYVATKDEAWRVRRAMQELTQANVSVFRSDHQRGKGTAYRLQADGWGERWGDALLAYLATGKHARTADIDNVRPFLPAGDS